MLVEKELEKVNLENLKETHQKLQELQTRHKLVLETYPIWPISLELIKKFSITASAPLITTLIQLLIDKFLP